MAIVALVVGFAALMAIIGVAYFIGFAVGRIAVPCLAAVVFALLWYGSALVASFVRPHHTSHVTYTVLGLSLDGGLLVLLGWMQRASERKAARQTVRVSETGLVKFPFARAFWNSVADGAQIGFWIVVVLAGVYTLFRLYDWAFDTFASDDAWKARDQRAGERLDRLGAFADRMDGGYGREKAEARAAAKQARKQQ